MTRKRARNGDAPSGRHAESSHLTLAVEPAIRTTQAVIGRKWHPLIVYHLLEDGPLGFSALETRLDGISSKMLSECLSDLRENAICRRERRQTDPDRVEYSLTDRGHALQPVIETMIHWGTDESTTETTPRDQGEASSTADGPSAWSEE